MSSASSGAALSHHPSNPLDAGPHDRSNNACQREYRLSLAEVDHLSSDDPIDAFAADNLKDYHQHISQVFPLHPMRKPSPKRPIPAMDEDMSEDELATPMKQDITPVATHNESNEEGHSDKDDANEYDDDNDDRMSVDSYETDEEDTINERSPEERKEILEEISDLMDSVPQLQGDYKILDRLGTGTFSSVYKALDLHYHTKWDNSPWHGHHPPSSSAHYQSAPRPKGSKVFVAIKRIYVTSSPERIKNEISILIDCLSCRHVSQLITATRCLDQVVVIMPYHRNEDFRVRVLAVSSTQHIDIL
jgi:cell division control protein 7